MPESETVRVKKSDKKRLKNIAESTDRKVADVVAELIRNPTYVCPSCDDPFAPAEIDPETVKKHSSLVSSLGNLAKGQKDVKQFDCPSCDETVRPDEIGEIDAEGVGTSGVTERDIGVTPENKKAVSASKEA